EALAAAYQELIVEELKRWRAGKAAPEGDAYSQLNWLLQNGLLDGDAKPSPDVARLLAKYREAEAALPAPMRAPTLADGTGEDESVFLRGNYRTPGERVPRRPPEAIVTAMPAPGAGSGRLELAHRLVDSSDPLLARVMVNRIWLHHFGEGIVRTPD